ncbi:hypothetical protein [Candidatus Poriferisocius sp.]|uniref:hypothetical protein n=1 Tax=Candidatus Poriferisocius sp. TaxID=3101276 RepID=UPI003B5201CF
MVATNRHRFKLAALAVVLALGAAACGDSGAPTTSTPATTPPIQAPAAEQAPVNEAPAPASDLPSVDVVNVATGATVNLASFAQADRPLVLWFWAPH